MSIDWKNRVAAEKLPVTWVQVHTNEELLWMFDTQKKYLKHSAWALLHDGLGDQVCAGVNCDEPVSFGTIALPEENHSYLFFCRRHFKTHFGLVAG
jgi:hypothetical protein